MTIGTHAQLLEHINSGNTVKYLFFWGHTNRSDTVNASCLSQWYPAKFEIEGRIYPTAEHFMMGEKARLFGDAETREKVFDSDDPGFAKAVGREVRGFDEEKWQRHRIQIVEQANIAKFSQNPNLGSFLLSTSSRVLVEASPRDRIWGIGLTKDDERANNPNLWKGLNLLGFALMNVREALSEMSS